MTVIRWLFALGPLWFGLGFLAPLLAQITVALGFSAPLGMSPLLPALLLGGMLGLIATWRGRWL